MFFKPSTVISKGDEMLKVSSKLSLRKFIRLLIGDAACQMKTAMLFKSPDDHLHISRILTKESDTMQRHTCRIPPRNAISCAFSLNSVQPPVNLCERAQI